MSTCPSYEYPLEIDRGLSFYESVQIKNAAGAIEDLTGSTFLMQIRDYPFSVDARLSCTDTNGLLDIQPTQGIINIQLTPTDTSLLLYNVGSYDLIQTKITGEKVKLLHGSITINTTVSRT